MIFTFRSRRLTASHLFARVNIKLFSRKFPLSSEPMYIIPAKCPQDLFFSLDMRFILCVRRTLSLSVCGYIKKQT